jgi:predicted metal-dependent HD superfamily phosphohydrolase
MFKYDETPAVLMRFATSRLERRWQELGNRIGVIDERTWDDGFHMLVANYSELNRKYHTLEHIKDGLRRLKMAAGFANLDAVEVAWWFHDAVYDTARKDSEERSADLAFAWLTASGVPKAFANKITAMILITKHDEEPRNMDSMALVDIDLSGLGATRRNSKNIREEYSFKTDEEYGRGHAEFMKRFLRSDYFLPPFQSKFGERRKRNLEEHIRELMR